MPIIDALALLDDNRLREVLHREVLEMLDDFEPREDVDPMRLLYLYSVAFAPFDATCRTATRAGGEDMALLSMSILNALIPMAGESSSDGDEHDLLLPRLIKITQDECGVLAEQRLLYGLGLYSDIEHEILTCRDSTG
uniref:Uncharacterized protein n=1 Tax=Trypanosoma congolense (strain IL3000) TaxID=1068625 RepID=G0UW71_TRYCI|nr:conserved hypothetical protein [Trypanosoma congolense IL3000]